MRRNAVGTLCIMTRTASRLAAAAGVMIAAGACSGNESATGPQTVLEQPTKPVLDLQPSGLTLFAGYSFLPFTNDVHGANDYSGQNDVNQLSRADNDGKFGVAWTWDETDAWTGAGQTGDACALFDTDATGSTGAGNVDFALCVRVTNLNGNPASPVQAEGSPILYQCSDKKNDRCTTTVVSIPKGLTFCEVVKTTTDAFPDVGADGADVMAACGVDLSAISASTAPKFLNVCSYPSGSPNSNPFDCILTPGAAYLKIVKATSPTATGTEFSFSLSPAAQNGTSSFKVTDTNEGNDESALIAISPSQTYNLSEVSLPAGWALSSSSCTGGTANTVSAFKVGVEGGTITCTFNNVQQGSITIVKDAKPNDAEDFAFTTSGDGLSTFSLDDDDNATLPSTKAFNNLVAGGTRTIMESAATGWAITNISCTGAATSTVQIGSDADFDTNDNSVTIGLAGGESVSCTFENTRLGSITIVKDAVPNNDQDFSFTTTNLTPATFDLDDDGTAALPANSRVFSGLLPGTYGVTEDGETGWALTSISCPGAGAATIGASSVSIVLAAGENVTCTFTNTQGGSITIVKDAVPDHEQDFSFATTGVGLDNPFSLDDDNNGTLPSSRVFSGLQPGLRAITENDVTGWTITNITCTGKVSSTVTIGAAGTFDAGDKSVSIDLAAGENITCTFVNTAPPTVNVEKSVLPTSIPETGGMVTYSIVVTNTSPIDVTLSSLTDNKFTITGAGECIVPANHVLAPGGTYSCSFTRTLPAGEALGTYVNEATATVTNAGGTGTDKDDATVTYTNVNPNISVTKTANPTSLSTVQAGSLTFTADQTWSSNPTPPSPTDPNFASEVCDDAGANDINSAQVDINCFDRADNIAGKLYVKWTWDDINAWSGGGSTGDGCALIDTDNDGNVNLAFCARITNGAGGAIVQVPQAGAVDVYVCNDTKTDRCAKPTTQLLGNANIGTTTCTIADAPEGFPNEGDDGSDTEATCIIDKTMPSLTNVSIDLVNVCTFPSGEPNSNPFDCVVEVGSGFIQIKKIVSPTSSQLFGFTLAGAANNGDTKFAVAGGVTSGLIAVAPGSGNSGYSLSETLPTNWTFTSVVCKIDNVATGEVHATLPQISKIKVESGQTTICEFTNTGVISGSVEYTIRVTNLGKEDVSLFSLVDDKFGDLNGVGSCVTGGTIAGSAAGNLYYECTFTKNLSGAPETSHTNEVTAVAKDNETPQNSDTKKASATVNFVSPP